MARIPLATTQLSYPLYSADFDPQNSGALLVGGGGGRGRSGISNKITLLDTSRTDVVSQIIDIELSRDEDAVMSLAAAQSSDSSISAFAGINSTLEEIKANKNQHLRAFQVDYPPSKGKSESTEPKDAADDQKPKFDGITISLGRSSLFKPSDSVTQESYQRVLRLSSPRIDGKPRLGAAASAFASPNEVVLFTANPQKADNPEIRGKIKIKEPFEASDVDITEDDDGNYHVAYCTDHEVFLYKVPHDRRRKASSKERLLYTMPEPNEGASHSLRSSFRSLRFLTPDLLLLLVNKPKRSGVELLVLRILGGLDGEIRLRKCLRKSTKAAVGLDICNLFSPDPLEKRKQIVVAVASQDISLELFLLDYSPATGLSKFKPFTYLKRVHPLPMTKICFSYFHPSPSSTSSPTNSQSIKLASVSMGNTVVVHTFALRPWPLGSRNQQYFLVPPGRSDTLSTALSVSVSLIVIIIAAFLFEAFSEIRGVVPPYLGATKWLSPGFRELVARPYVLSSPTPSGDAYIVPTSASVVPTTSSIPESTH